MEKFLFYDVETTGLPDFSSPAEKHENHPGIAQIAAVLVGEDRKIYGSINLIICQPQGIKTSEEATKIHGITREMMDSLGVTTLAAIHCFSNLMDKSTKIVAFNRRFDEKMVRIEMHRIGVDGMAEELRNKPVDCCMEMANEIMQMCPTEKMMAVGFKKSKNPKLTEAYEYFTGKPMVNAHDAWADVMGMIEVYFAIKDRNQQKKEA